MPFTLYSFLFLYKYPIHIYIPDKLGYSCHYPVGMCEYWVWLETALIINTRVIVMKVFLSVRISSKFLINYNCACNLVHCVLGFVKSEFVINPCI